MGDSLTAGAGLMATNVFHIVLEHRGIAPVLGGKGSWRRYLTLPNILKNFNPNLTGYATQNSLTLHAESGLNLGEVAAVSEDTPYMAKVLVQRMKVNPNIDVKKHWKMVTFMIGPNDFCSEICFEKNLTATLERHRKDLIQVLTILKINLPRTIVNLIPPPSIKLLTELVGKSFACEISHLVECPCLFGPTSGNRQEIYFKLMEQWQQLDIEIGNSEEFDSDDFTVVVQPFTLDFSIPKTKTGSSDFSYLSEDCFHMSQKGNARIANSLWNNIMEPVGAKSQKAVDVFHQIRCPTKEDPFIFTRRNSVRVFNMSNKK
ncbi:unnamed protein product [Tenebrio molitor]|nr:unnamed protein product [Tenebrio molitor]